MKQQTIKTGFSLNGKGLHSGLPIIITFHPAPADFGYAIRRTDLADKPIIKASAENVVFTDRCTTIAKNNVRVATVEHALAALYSLEIDNCLIDVDGPEFPILDGSAIEYVKAVKDVGIVTQGKEREYFMVDKKIEYFDTVSGSHLILLPSDTFRIQTQISFDSVVLDVQSAQMDSLSDFAGEIAMCRTFVFIKDINFLLEKGLIKGGGLNNAIVIYDQKITQKELDKIADMMGVESKNADELGYIVSQPLRFPNEPARHKLLDIIGDVALAGKFIKGTIIAVRPGHKANNHFARKIAKEIEYAII